METVVLLSHKKPDGHIHVKVEFGEGEGKVPLDNIVKRAEVIFHIDYLKHNTVMAFPSVLVSKEIPDFVDYEISSKHVADVVKGTVEIKK